MKWIWIASGALSVAVFIAVFGFATASSSPVTNKQFNEHVESADSKFNNIQERIVEKLDQIEQAIIDNHKK